MSRRYGTRARAATVVCDCGKPTRDGAFICEACLDGLAKDLRSLLPDGDEPGLWADLQSVIAGERGIDYRALGGSSGGSDATGLILDELATKRAATIRKILRQLVIDTMAARVQHTAPAEWAPRSTDRVPAMAEWLSWRVSGMAWHPEFATAPHRVAKAVKDVNTTVMPLPHRQYLGPCPVTGCDGTMRASRDEETFASCRRCGAMVEATPLRDRLIAELENRLCTAAEIADLYDPDPAVRPKVRHRLNVWASRSRLLGWPRVCDWSPGVCAWPAPARGHNVTGHGLVFRFGDAFDLLLDHERRTRESQENR